MKFFGAIVVALLLVLALASPSSAHDDGLRDEIVEHVLIPCTEDMVLRFIDASGSAWRTAS